MDDKKPVLLTLHEALRLDLIEAYVAREITLAEVAESMELTRRQCSRLIGLRLGNGKYCTLRLFFVLADINRPQRSILPFCQFFIVSPDIISRQINVLPAQRRQV